MIDAPEEVGRRPGSWLSRENRRSTELSPEDRTLTNLQQFRSNAKMRHDFSDQIQVRYPHPNGEMFDTWISGEEVMQRLNSDSRERLIRSFRDKNWRKIRDEASELIDEGKKRARGELKDRLADQLSQAMGDNIFGDTMADKIRGSDGSLDPHDQEKLMWQARLKDESFRDIALELAWIDLEGTFPDELSEEPDDWI